ncbi:MAG: DsrE family protein [Thermodesulfobacteriota bacterium]
MSHKTKTVVLLTLVLAVLLIPQTLLSQNRGEETALAGLSQLKVYFDVKADSAAKLEKRLEWINDAYEQVSGQGIKPSFVVGFRSRASFFVTKGEEYVDEKEISTKVKIEKWLRIFREKGMVMEQCGLSAELFEIDREDFLAPVRVVKSGYVSIAGYQNQGYAYVPM